MDLTQANLIDRVCEKSGAENNDDLEDEGDGALQVSRSKVQKLEDGARNLGGLGCRDISALNRNLHSLPTQ